MNLITFHYWPNTRPQAEKRDILLYTSTMTLWEKKIQNTHPHCSLYIKCRYKHFISMQKNENNNNNKKIQWRSVELKDCHGEKKQVLIVWDTSHDVVGSINLSVNDEFSDVSMQVHLNVTLKVYGLGWNRRVSFQNKTCTVGKTRDLVFIKSYYFKQV